MNAGACEQKINKHYIETKILFKNSKYLHLKKL